jgi:hypothetical protein
MKKVFLLVFLSLFSSILLAQNIELSESDLKNQLDSVLKEGNLLYKYEKSTWIATDLAQENPIVKPDFYSYFTYEDSGEIKIIILGKNRQFCVAEYVFEEDFDNPKYVRIDKRNFSDKEKGLIEMREKIFDNISNPKYGISVPYDGYSLNFILIPYANKYKFYVITGTEQENVIPFGNDYIFITNKKGKIKSWHKFHSRLIPGYTMYDGNKVTEMTHSHMRTTPLITATDICTFMLYAPLYDIDAFSVYSPAIGKYMKYNWKENAITVLPAD